MKRTATTPSMDSIAHRALSAASRLFAAQWFLVLLSIPSVVSAAASDYEMREPVLNVKYDIRGVQFELAPVSLPRCEGQLAKDKYWLYAQWKDGDSEFLVISSLATKYHPIGLVITSARCIVGDADWLMSGSPPGPSSTRGPYQGFTIPDSALHGVCADALRRAALAFGGKKKYLAMIAKFHVRLGDPEMDLTPEFMSEFVKFATSP